LGQEASRPGQKCGPVFHDQVGLCHDKKVIGGGGGVVSSDLEFKLTAGENGSEPRRQVQNGGVMQIFYPAFSYPLDNLQAQSEVCAFSKSSF
jgi:hypothetical protein